MSNYRKCAHRPPGGGEKNGAWKWDVFLTLFFTEVLQNTDIRIVQ